MAAEITVDVESLAFGGDAVGRQRDPEGARTPDDGRVTFVPLAAPGERVRARIERAKGKVAWAELTAIDAPGPDRVPPPCPLFGTCGGCQWQHVGLPAQHAAKHAIVARALTVELPPVVAASAAYGYRDRCRLAVGAGGALGFRARRSHDVVDVPACPLFGPELARALPALRAMARGLAAGVELDVQAGADGVHVNVVRADPTSAAHARREVDRLSAAGVVGLALAGKPTFGQPDVDVAEPGSPRCACRPTGSRRWDGRQRGAGRCGAGGGRAVAGRRARALCRQRQLHPPPGADRGVGRRVGRRSGGGRARAGEMRPGRRGHCGRVAGAARIPWCWTRRARGQIAPIWPSPQARAGASSTFRAIRRPWGGTRARGGRGAAPDRAVALDLMPQTFHVEVVATFQRD